VAPPLAKNSASIYGMFLAGYMMMEPMRVIEIMYMSTTVSPLPYPSNPITYNEE
jgi:hypothetical protein